jgi:hypothetical protein
MGMTGSGKSYSIRKILMQQGAGLLYFNTQHEELKGVQGKFTTATGKHTFAQIREAISRDKMINFLPSTDEQKCGDQLSALVNGFYDHKVANPFWFVVDEVHLYNDHKQAIKAIRKIYTTGRKWGILGGSLSTRPAEVHNTIISMSRQKFIFYCDEWEQQYFNRYKLNYADMMKRITDNGEHSFLIMERGQIGGPYKV